MKFTWMKTLLAATLIMTAIGSNQAHAENTAPSVLLNGQPLSFLVVQPMRMHNRIYVPYRPLLEALGATVSWDEQTKTATAIKDGMTIQLPIQSRTLMVNGNPLTIDEQTEMINDQMMVPLRFVAQVLGATVNWVQNKSGGQVVITQPNSKAENRSDSGQSTLSQEVPILEYHSISNQLGNPYCVNPAMFDIQMEYLKNAGYHTITFNDLEQAWYHQAPLPEKPILITFDDGYQDNFTDAYPILKKDKFNGTIFMVSGSAGKPNHLTWPEMIEMEKSGLIDIQSHTVHHVNLTKVSELQARMEIFGSKNELESHLPNPIFVFCYPYGAYNEKIVNIVQSAGYVFGTIGQTGYASPAQGKYTLHRIIVIGTDPVLHFVNNLRE